MNRILLVENNLYLREVNKIKLQYDCNAKVETAASAVKAIEMLQRNLPYKFIVCDYSIPDGDGLKVLKYLENRNTKTPFVFYTCTMGLKIDTTYSHYSGIIYKFDYEKLVKSIMKHFSHPQAFLDK